MAKVKVLIVEDELEEGLELKESLLNLGYQITAIVDNIKDALGYFYSQEPDIVLIDIYLQGTPDGLQLATKINENAHSKRPFIYITKASDRSTFEQAIQTKPDSYLIKPFNPLEVQYAIELAIEKHFGNAGALSSQNETALQANKDFYIKKGHVLHKVSASDIYFVAVEGKYSELITENDKFLVQWPLKSMVEKINRDDFVRVHRNYAVNTRVISKVHLKDQQLILKNDAIIPVSQNFKDNLTKKLDILK